MRSLFQPPTPSSRTSRLPDPNQVKELLVQIVDVEKRVPGIVVGMIAADPQERWVVGYGRLSASDERVPDGDTVYEIGSITKVFTGILLAQAVLKGEVKLDDPISMYLPEGVTAPDYEGKSITLLDLATHTSGLPRDVYDLHTLEQMYAFLSGYPLTREPGSSYAYSNYGMGLLGNLLVQKVSQADYEALLLERICRPLGMDSTRVQLTEEMRSRLAPPHTASLAQTHLWDYPIMAGAGMIRSTANDLLTFLAANMGLTEMELQPILQLANTPQRTSAGKHIIGLGWQVAANTGFHYHGGRTNGSYSYLAWDPERKFGVVVLANVEVDIDYVVRLLIGRMPFALVQADPKVLSSYAGRYQLLNGSIVTIRVDGARIFIQLPGEPEYELFASSGSHFYLPVSDAELLKSLELTFYRNDRGEVDRAVGVLGSETYETKKVP
ncbi:MAG TPA: serine hydrolase [Anaerolineales bacterium]|nr:serine hydrolase [Anaerolineales bacterium]